MTSATPFFDEWSSAEIKLLERGELASLSKNSVEALIAWIFSSSSSTLNYRVKGEDTLTVGDQTRWIQVRGVLASVRLSNEEFILSDEKFRENLSKYNNLLSVIADQIFDFGLPEDIFEISSEQKTRAAIQLLRSWREGDEREQQNTWEYLKRALDEDRLSNRRLFG